MTQIGLLGLVFSLAAAAAPEPDASWFEQAEALYRENQKAEALAKAEEAVVELDRAVAANEKIGRRDMEGLRWAARVAREDFLDRDKSLFFCEKMFAYADNDYWRVPARLERALTYRAFGELAKAQQEYDAVAAAEERHRVTMLLPQAEMVLYEVGDHERGRKLLEEALRNPAVNGRGRYNALRDCAQRAMRQGRREEALKWYGMLEHLPFDKPDERARFLSQAWYEMGRIEESRGRSSQAKAYYRNAMELENGEMRYRALARDAMESIEYFE